MHKPMISDIAVSANSNLPTIKEQFLNAYYNPATVDLAKYRASQDVCFETAKENYESTHGHQLPFGLRAFQRFVFECTQRERGKS